MALKVCMNIYCGAKNSPVWKEGWIMKSGQIALLCVECGSAYERQRFCSTFHADDSGWRECKTCGKALHCGCVASEAFLETLDFGGVKCISCARNPEPYSSKTVEGHGAVNVDSIGIKCHDNYEDADGTQKGPLPRTGSLTINVDSNMPLEDLKQADLSSHGVGIVCSSNTDLSLVKTPKTIRHDIYAANIAAKDLYGPVQQNLRISLGGPATTLASYAGLVIQEREQSNLCASVQRGPELQYSSRSSGCDTNLSMTPQVRVARPPIERRGQSQLLPRYWPRITDQELQQLSGDSNYKIVPLFEKVLSASDAGRMGRMVLPKACAEEYFPRLTQPEGLPIEAQDGNGKEWVFQFRYWPNNNSRMYVLEGVSPFIQAMQLQAGDTVTFSRMDPGRKIVMGCRKASISMQVKLRTDPCASALVRQMTSAGGHITSNNDDQNEGEAGEGTLISSMPRQDKKKSRNIGLKSKRLLIDNQEMLKLKLSWEEVINMIRPPQGAKPSIVMIDDQEIEEYEEPPVFGKWSTFVTSSSGLLEQWAQCDSCCKWRRLPVDVLLPPKWSCAENIWDQCRSSCSAPPDDLAPRELENYAHVSQDFIKKKKVALSHKTVQDQESSGLDALANAATLADNVRDSGASSVAATTRHPRHRPGCTCIVCIQPPSGKGKHKPSCTCNVCTTVKRRFKTLMLRKKKRQSEQEAEIALRNNLKQCHRDGAEADSFSGLTTSHLDQPDNEVAVINTLHSVGHSHNLTSKLAESSKVVDLNCQPICKDHLQQAGLACLSMGGDLHLDNQPTATCTKQISLQTLTSEQQASTRSLSLHQATGETEGQPVQDGLTINATQQKQENAGYERGAPDQSHNVTQ